MGYIPGTRTVPFLEKKWVVEAVTVGPPVLAASIAAWNSWRDFNTAPPTSGSSTTLWEVGLLVVGVLWLVGASILRVRHAYVQDQEQKRNQEHDGLRGAQHVLYEIIRQYLKLPQNDTGRLRITIHRVVPAQSPHSNPEKLQQLLHYVGGSGGGPGRTFSVRSGIIGRAVREATPIAATRQGDDYETYIQELVSKWSYTEADARNLSRDRFSWMAVPISGKNGVVAVVYLDSNEKQFFKPAIQRRVINACVGIAKYIEERY
jgi:hypothetical protein